MIDDHPTAHLGAALALLWLGGCTGASKPPIAATEAVPAGFRERVAAVALAQVPFGAVSLLPVSFEKSRIAGPFEDGGRTLYCVTSRMRGRSLLGTERAKVVIREEIGSERLSVVRDEPEVCEGHRSVPFPELEAYAARRS
ncbi:hypothetical protein U8607_18630 [Methylobacterium durans]|uniref:hypothetical protein n=1 Tax=Methylobacterium durans TaxID=2202825 RepID=UPI002AFF6A57|nr:hypothetical protein [Methylobacterium durans]MEA1834109.1 hypothetical protein [Methylobacterium durans]